jgi:hypothetical protein
METGLLIYFVLGLILVNLLGIASDDFAEAIATSPVGVFIYWPCCIWVVFIWGSRVDD